MTAANVNNAAASRQVACATSDDEIPVDCNVLRVSRTFKKMYEDLALEEHHEFPGVFPVRDISSEVFMKVIAWCEEHNGLPEPVIEKDAFTQVVKCFELTPFEEQFLDIPVSALFELITAANLLDIPSLYHAAYQVIAGLIKGKSPVEVRRILRQRCDLSEEDFQEIFSQNPWLEQYDEEEVNIEEPIDIPAEVLVTILEKLPRADIERLQLVSSRFRNVILNSQKPFRELSEECGPLRPVDVDLNPTDLDGDYVTSLDGSRPSVCEEGLGGFAKQLVFCTVRKFRIVRIDNEVSDEFLKALSPLKRAWKDANFRCWNISDEQFRLAFTEVFICKEIHLGAYPARRPAVQPFLRLPGLWQCNVLEIDSTIELKASDIREWLEGGAHKQLVLWEPVLIGGVSMLVDSLKKAFLDADRPHAYKVRITKQRFMGHLFTESVQPSQQLWNDKTKEHLDIRADDGDIIVERK